MTKVVEIGTFQAEALNEVKVLSTVTLPGAYCLKLDVSAIPEDLTAHFRLVIKELWSELGTYKQVGDPIDIVYFNNTNAQIIITDALAHELGVRYELHQVAGAALYEVPYKVVKL